MYSADISYHRKIIKIKKAACKNATSEWQKSVIKTNADDKENDYELGVFEK